MGVFFLLLRVLGCEYRIALILGPVSRGGLKMLTPRGCLFTVSSVYSWACLAERVYPRGRLNSLSYSGYYHS